MFDWLKRSKDQDDYLTPTAMLVAAVRVAKPDWKEITITRVDGGVSLAIRSGDSDRTNDSTNATVD